MPRTCTICNSPYRDDIDRALIHNQPFRHIASRYGTSTGALQRHKANDLPLTLTKAKEAQDAAHGGELLSQVQDLNQRTLRILTMAEDSGDLNAALRAIREVRGNHQLLARMLGELQQTRVAVQVNTYQQATALSSVPDKFLQFIWNYKRLPTDTEMKELTRQSQVFDITPE